MHCKASGAQESTIMMLLSCSCRKASHRIGSQQHDPVWVETLRNKALSGLASDTTKAAQYAKKLLQSWSQKAWKSPDIAQRNLARMPDIMLIIDVAATC